MSLSARWKFLFFDIIIRAYHCLINEIADDFSVKRERVGNRIKGTNIFWRVKNIFVAQYINIWLVFTEKSSQHPTRVRRVIPKWILKGFSPPLGKNISQFLFPTDLLFTLQLNTISSADLCYKDETCNVSNAETKIADIGDIFGHEIEFSYNITLDTVRELSCCNPIYKL